MAELTVGDARLWLAAEHLDERGEGPSPGALVLWKTEKMVEGLRQLVHELQPLRIVELGIANGGSTALLAALAPNAKILALDIIAGCPVLDDYLSTAFASCAGAAAL